jgi:PAS domain S-box-containing protein
MIRAKMVIVMTGTMLMCLVVFGLFTLVRANFAIVDSEVARLTLLADARASDIEDLAAGYQERANLMANRLRLRSLLAAGDSLQNPAAAASATRLLDDTAANDDVIQSISVLDADRTIVISTDEALIGRQATAAAVDPGQADDPDGVGEMQAVFGTSSVQLVAVAPVDLDGEHLGAVQMTFATAEIEALVESAGFDRTGEIVDGLRDTSGAIRLITTSGTGAPPSQLVDPGQDAPIVRAIQGESASVTDADGYQGVEVIAVTRGLQGLDSGLVVQIDSEEVELRLWSAWIAFQVLALVLLTFSAAAGLLTGRRVEAAFASRLQAETRFTTLFTSAPSAMLLVAEDGSIALANRRAAELFGYDVDALSTMQVEDLVPTPLGARHTALRTAFGEARAMRAGLDLVALDLVALDLVALAGDGREVPVEISLTPIDTDDGHMVIASVVDLTERKRVATALEERADALARSNHDLDHFAYIASHDLKAPLRAMEQLAGFVLEDAGDVLPEQSHKDLEQVQQRSKRLMALLNGLLQFSRIGRGEGSPSWIDMNATLAELIDLYVPTDRFDLEISGSLPDVHAPQPAVELVFRNLLMNAVKHHDRDHGQIRIGCRPDGRFLCFTVADDGPGIPPTHRDKVFELFGTVKARDTDDASGMGLALVKRTIENQGGTIRLTGDDGRGTTIEVRWPRRSSSPHPEPDPPTDSSRVPTREESLA